MYTLFIIRTPPPSRQVTTQSTGGMGGAWFTNMLMSFSQSAEDGTMPLLYCMARPEAQSGELYEPNGFGGPAVKQRPDRLSSDATAKAVLWEESCKAVGEFVARNGANIP